MSDDLLVKEDVFLTAGVHIGTKVKSKDMLPFIYKVRNDGLYILDVRQTNDRIKDIAKFLSKYDPSEILVAAQRQYGQKPASKFAETIGANSVCGRLIPGRLTNPELSDYIEPSVIILTDPSADNQALKEAVKINIPTIALCDANNMTKYIDIILPTNNKGRRSLAMIYWLLTREVLKAYKKIKKDEEYTLSIDDFEAQL